MGKRKWGSGSAAEWLWAPETMRWRRTYSGQLDQVQAARHFVRALFAGAACADMVEYAVGELGSNALRHTRSSEPGGWFGLEVTYSDPAYVAVTDIGGYGIPAVREPSEDLREYGRGLYALSELAVALGIHGSSTVGHTVWVDLDLDQALGTQPGSGILLAS